jgi:hypothetical protein
MLSIEPSICSPHKPLGTRDSERCCNHYKVVAQHIFPIYGKIKFMLQNTNQIYIYIYNIIYIHIYIYTYIEVAELHKPTYIPFSALIWPVVPVDSSRWIHHLEDLEFTVFVFRVFFLIWWWSWLLVDTFCNNGIKAVHQWGFLNTSNWYVEP